MAKRSLLSRCPSYVVKLVRITVGRKTFIRFWSEISKYSTTTYRHVKCGTKPIPVTAPSRVWVYGCSLPGIAGSNPARGMDVHLLRALCVVKVEVST